MCNLNGFKFKLIYGDKFLTEEVNAFTIIDQATSWLEFILARSFTFDHVAFLFDNNWLC